VSVKQWNVGDVLASADMNTWTVPLVGLKASDTSRASNTTAANDPDLIVQLAANATYEWRTWINYEGGTQGSSDLKIQFTSVPSGATLRGSATYVNASGGAVVEVYVTSGGGSLAAGTNGGGAIRGFRAVGTIVTSSTASGFAISWAQNTSSGTATVVHAGSILKAWRVS
jgi:hypothetical protein